MRGPETRRPIPRCVRVRVPLQALQKKALKEVEAKPRLPGLEGCRQQLAPYVCAHRETVRKEMVPGWPEVSRPGGGGGKQAAQQHKPQAERPASSKAAQQVERLSA